MKPHKHAELIKAWADGAEIEFYDTRFEDHQWKLCGNPPLWDQSMEYRIKPEAKSKEWLWAYINHHTGRIELSTSSISIPVGFLILGKFKLEDIK